MSQTEGEPLPSLGVEELTGDVERYQDFFKALEQTSPVPMAFEDIPGGSHGYYHLTEKRIAIQENMSELQTLKTAIHEIAHAKLHAIDPEAPADRAGRPARQPHPRGTGRERGLCCLPALRAGHVRLFLWVCGRLEFRQRPERAAGVP